MSPETPDAPDFASVAPPAALAAHWARAGLAIPPVTSWLPIGGGRTNAVWKVPGPDGDLVVKLYRGGGDTPLFRNDPAAEYAALVALAGTGVAPEPVAMAETSAGHSLVYRHVAGTTWASGDDPSAVAHALARLHRRAPPPGLDPVADRAAGLRAQARAILRDVGVGSDAARRSFAVVDDLARLEPGGADETSPAPMAFLHGDPTAGNTLVDGGHVAFVDWQCPALGDPADDLAVFLSPAMQAISGNPPLTADQEDAFLAGYGDAAAVARYQARARLYHWRMAAHCLWRAARGDAGYAAAAALEVDRLRTP